MKTIFKYTLLMLLLVSCNPEDEQIICLTVLADRTDENLEFPEMDEIKSLMELDRYTNSKVIFRFQNIGNTDFNRTYRLALDSHSMLGNTLQRRADVKKFYRTIDTLLQNEKSREYDYRSSSIFTPLVKHLKTLEKVEARRKIILLYSDIFEFSDIYNVYDNASQRKLYSKPEIVSKRFRSKLHGKKLDGMELYLIFYPATTTENKLFQSLVGVYEEIFKDTGLEIHVGIEKQLTLKP